MLRTSQLARHSHASGTLRTASAGAHKHGISSAGDTNLSPATSTSRDGNTKDLIMYTASAGEHTHTISGSTGIQGSAEAHNNVQPTMVMNWIVKT